MTDTVTVLAVARLGYDFHKDDETQTWWFSKSGHVSGPFKSLDDAAYEALAEHEINEAYKFWRGKDAEARKAQ